MAKLNPIAAASELIDEINSLHQQSLQSAANALSHALACGQKLNEAKKHIGHGNWTGWLEQNVKFPPRTARLYMQLADHGDKITKWMKDFGGCPTGAAMKCTSGAWRGVRDDDIRGMAKAANFKASICGRQSRRSNGAKPFRLGPVKREEVGVSLGKSNCCIDED